MRWQGEWFSRRLKLAGYVSGWTSGADVTRIRTLFEKWFTNKVRAIHFDRTGMWEHPVRVAAKVDLAGWDTTRLVFYAYDPKTNLYRRLAAPAYWIDANGYLRFQTEYAGDIIISEGIIVTAAPGKENAV